MTRWWNAAIPALFCGLLCTTSVYASPLSQQNSPKIKIGTAIVLGHLSKRALRQRIWHNLPAIRFCYENQLRLTPGMGNAMIKTRIEIATTGQVLHVQANEGIKTNPWKRVAVCVTGVIQSIEFTAVRNGGVTEVHYPFLFFLSDSFSTPSSSRDSAVSCCDVVPSTTKRLKQLRTIMATGDQAIGYNQTRSRYFRGSLSSTTTQM